MKNLLSFGWIVATINIIGTYLMGLQVPNYSIITHTFSEIGTIDSPLYMQWMLFKMFIAFLFVLFSMGLFLFSRLHQVSFLPSIFILGFGLCLLGSSYFATPHPYHNLFGATNLLWYLSPLVFCFTWKGLLGSRFKKTSLVFLMFIIVGIILNLTPLFAPNLAAKYYGLFQRFVVFSFYIYCAYVSVLAIKYFKNQELYI